MSEYKPDKWVMLKFSSGGTNTYKVFAGWAGSYLHGQSWKLNSGVTKIEENGDYYLFHGYSGSVYKCHKKAYGWTSYMMQVFNSFEEQIKESVGSRMDLLPEETNFMEIDYEQIRAS
jgi:hypothetical protein